jgi:hypothetical protein
MKAKDGIIGDWKFVEEDQEVDESVRTNRCTFMEYLK